MKNNENYCFVKFRTKIIRDTFQGLKSKFDKKNIKIKNKFHPNKKSRSVSEFDSIKFY